MKLFSVSLAMLCLLASSTFSQSKVPGLMNYQGYLTDAAGTPVADGNYNITFLLYDQENGGVPLWTEIHPTVVIKKGLFNVVLGRGTPPSPIFLPFDAQYFLGVRVGGDPEMTPRVRLTTNAYCFRSRTAEDVLEPTYLKESELTAGTGISISNAGGTLQLSVNPATLTLAGDVSGPLGSNVIGNNTVTADKILPNIITSLNGVTNDAGNINLIAGSNITLTPNDAANTITIDAVGGGLMLPYVETTNLASATFDIKNSGAGSVAKFSLANAGTSNPALSVSTTSTNANGDAISVVAGEGNAVQAINNSASMAAIGAINTGDGIVASFGKLAASAGNIVNVLAAGGTGKGVSVTYAGTSQGVFVNSTGSGTGIEVQMDGTKNAAYFHIDNTSSSQNCLRAVTASTNTASDALEIVASAGNALDAMNNSATEPTARISNDNSSSTARALYTTSSGMYGTIESRNYNASSNALIFSGYSGTTERFRMFNSGNFFADGSLFANSAYLTVSLGSSSTPIAGGVYQDNIVYAWANVSSIGTLVGGFGCTTTRSTTGTYVITYKKSMSSSDYAPVATAVEATAPQFAVISAASTTGCTVKIWKFSGGAFSLVDSQFFFQLTGRP